VSVIAIIGAAGGTGSTTVTSHLATAIAQQNRPVICFDFCPTNVLRLHFGDELSNRDGFAAALMAGLPWQYATYTSDSGVRFLPFGELENDTALDRLSNWMQVWPNWLRHSVHSIDLPADVIVLCDCARLPASLRNQVLAAADITLVTCSPDPLSFASAIRLASQMQIAPVQSESQQSNQLPPEPSLHGPVRSPRIGAVLLNGFEAGKALDRDIRLLLRRHHAHLAAPVAIHRDEALREALACKQTVFEYAPTSQAALEFSALATWAITRSAQRTLQSLPA
jgi:cellulose synthase operon protein YhjQ